MISSLATDNWITFLFVILMGILVLLKTMFPLQFRYFIAFFRLNQYFVKYISIIKVLHPFNVLLLLFQFFIYGFLLFKIVTYYNISTITSDSFLYTKIILFLVILYSFRFLIGKIIFSVFKLSSRYEAESIYKLTYLSKLSIYVFPFLIAFHYYNFEKGFLILSVFTAIFLLYFYILILIKNQKNIFTHYFYFILYLCTLEILPLYLFYKVLIYKL